MSKYQLPRRIEELFAPGKAPDEATLKRLEHCREVIAWNAKVDAKKAAKLRRKLARRNP